MVWVKRSVKPSASSRRCSEPRASLRRSLGRCAGHGINDLNQYREPETATLVLGLSFDRAHFRSTASVAAVSSLEQDQSEWQIECQNRARESLSRACECLRGLLFSLLNPLYLR
jgi:hypothetical protein